MREETRVRYGRVRAAVWVREADGRVMKSVSSGTDSVVWVRAGRFEPQRRREGETAIATESARKATAATDRNGWN